MKNRIFMFQIYIVIFTQTRSSFTGTTPPTTTIPSTSTTISTTATTISTTSKLPSTTTVSSTTHSTSPSTCHIFFKERSCALNYSILAIIVLFLIALLFVIGYFIKGKRNHQ